MPIESIFVVSAGCLCFNTVISHIPKVCEWLYKKIFFGKSITITRLNDMYVFTQICSDIDTYIASKPKKIKESLTSIHLSLNGKDENGASVSLDKRFMVFAPGTIITLPDFDISIEVLGDSRGNLEGFVLHENKHWNPWHKTKEFRIESFLIRLGNFISSDCRIYVPFSSVLLSVFAEINNASSATAGTEEKTAAKAVSVANGNAVNGKAAESEDERQGLISGTRKRSNTSSISMNDIGS